MRKIFISIFFFVLFGGLVSGSALAQNIESRDIVRVCHGNGGWPPFHFQDAKNQSGSMVGSTIDILREVFRLAGLTYSTEALPWKRCLEHVRTAATFEVIADGTFNMARTQDYYYTTPLYQISPVLVIHSQSPINGRKINTPGDLKGISLCANRATNIAAFGMAKADIYAKTSSIPHGLKMLDLKRCNGYLAFKEIVEGFYAIDDKGALPKDLSFIDLPYADRVGVHLLISKKSARAEKLTVKLNQALLVLHDNKTIERIRERYRESISAANPSTR